MLKDPLRNVYPTSFPAERLSTKAGVLKKSEDMFLDLLTVYYGVIFVPLV